MMFSIVMVKQGIKNYFKIAVVNDISREAIQNNKDSKA